MEWSFDTRDAQSTRDTRIAFMKYAHRYFGPAADVSAAELVLGELIGNVVRYAPGRAHVQADFDERGVTIAVQDSGSGFFPRQGNRAPVGLFSESGRGLAIVSKLARTVEIDCPDHDGCRVRARLDLDLRRN